MFFCKAEEFRDYHFNRPGRKLTLPAPRISESCIETNILK